MPVLPVFPAFPVFPARGGRRLATVIAMADPLKTLVDGVEVEVPNTIPDIRAALPEERRADFDLAINAAGLDEIHAVMRHWMLEAVPDPEAEARLARLASDEAERRGGEGTDRRETAEPDRRETAEPGQRATAEPDRHSGCDRWRSR